MEAKLVFLGAGRQPSRWRVQIVAPPGALAATVGLWGENGRPLGPSVVAPLSAPGPLELDVGGPLTLPAGACARGTLDLAGGEVLQLEALTDPRRGVHAFLRADRRLDVPAGAPPVHPLSARDMQVLRAAWPWLEEERPAETSPAADAPPEDPLRDLLRDFDVDVDDLDDDTREGLRRRM
jgi:hypothetical protein